MDTETAPETAAAVAPVPRIVFNRFIPSARFPQRADRSAAGSLPTRAFRYCEPVATASAFGYYVFPPMAFSLRWDGSAIRWTYPGAEDWMLLTVAQFPHYVAEFDSHAPEEIRGFSPPFLGALQEPGHVQMWTGMVMRTAPGWSALVRPPANLPMPGGYVAYEGIVETDRWFGPLFTNLRLTRTNVPIRLRADFPLIQIQPIPRQIYTDAVVEDMEVGPTLEGFSAADWADYDTSIAEPSRRPDRPFGAYAVAARKDRRAGCPFSKQVEAA